jgi:hypothetical protein
MYRQLVVNGCIDHLRRMRRPVILFHLGSTYRLDVSSPGHYVRSIQTEVHGFYRYLVRELR